MDKCLYIIIIITHSQIWSDPKKILAKKQKLNAADSKLRYTEEQHKPQHTLQVFANHYGPIPEIIYSTNDQRNQDQLPEFCTGYKTIRRKFIVQGNFKLTRYFHMSIVD